MPRMVLTSSVVIAWNLLFTDSVRHATCCLPQGRDGGLWTGPGCGVGVGVGVCCGVEGSFPFKRLTKLSKELRPCTLNASPMAARAQGAQQLARWFLLLPRRLHGASLGRRNTWSE